MDSVYAWDRPDKLFAIRCARLREPSDRESILKQLIVDDDPVVRGKAAIAMKPCSDQVLVESAKTLLDQEDPNKSILAMELLGFTESTDFSDHLKTPLESNDERVVKSAIETLHQLPIESSIPLINEILSRYQSAFKKPLLRTLEKIQNVDIVPTLRLFYDKIDADDQIEVIRVAASLDSDQTADWIQEVIQAQDVSDNQIEALRWLNSEK